MQSRPLRDRFMEKFEMTEGGCWMWTASRKPNGYGQISEGRGSLYAHRVSYELHHGPIPDGMFVCHSCDEPSCVNPSHLFIGTPSQNTKDSVAKGRWKPGGKDATHCQRGHEFTAENTGSNTGGRRSCRTCSNAAKMRYKERVRSLT